MTYVRTARHLRPTQVYHQIRGRLLCSKPILSVTTEAAPGRLHLLPWIPRQKAYLGRGAFKFLNSEKEFGSPIDWKAAGISSLWRYHLHYFDYLHQEGLDRSAGFKLVKDWIDGNPASENGPGWEPYPTSLRLVNWIKFFSIDDRVLEEFCRSMVLQVVNLQNRIEYHLLGNHLWANGKALWFAGIFLGLDWIADRGRAIVSEELGKQFLPDGGHFELSPMYHSIVLEDLLDLVNLCRSHGGRPEAILLPVVEEAARKSLAWLEGLIDERGQIPLLNDSAQKAAPSYEALRSYARRLGVADAIHREDELYMCGWRGRNLSGYLVLKKDPFRLVFDSARLGPDHLPGHAHCDMLSVLLDFEGKSVWTDTGVFEYEEGDRRLYSRGTSAHNTVVIDGLEQAEIWKSFRVGRRGWPKGFRITEGGFECSHTGFALWKRGLRHTRSIRLGEGTVEIIDRVDGVGKHSYRSFFHFHPGVNIVRTGNGYRVDQRLSITPVGARSLLTASEYYPEFGRIEERPCLVLEGDFSRSASFGVRCTFCS